MTPVAGGTTTKVATTSMMTSMTMTMMMTKTTSLVYDLEKFSFHLAFKGREVHFSTFPYFLNLFLSVMYLLGRLLLVWQLCES
jgi:hypothetical protein